MQRSHLHTPPLQVVNHPALTVREKLDWLAALKAELTADYVEPDALDYDLDEIDAAAAQVRAEAMNGTAPAPLPDRGSYGWH